MRVRWKVDLRNLGRALGNFRLISINRYQPNFVLTFSMCLLESLLSFRSSDQQELSARDSISLSQKDLVGESMRLRMKCQDQEEKLAR